MAVNKVVFGVEVLIDLTGINVTPETLAKGVIAINAAGEIIVGTATFGNAATSELGVAKLGTMELGS